MRTGIGALVLAGAAVLAAGLGAASSAAATAKTWTVRPGGPITATAGKTTVVDTATGSTESCISSSLSGTVKAGSGLPGPGIGSIAAVMVGRCAAAGFAPQLTPRGLPWKLNLSSYNARTGVARGTISHLQLAFTLPEVGCIARINGTSSAASDGTVAVTYATKAGTLKILTTGGDLHWYHVRSCAGLLRDGDPATLSASYAVSPRQSITSP
jgi:hypothetical protein